MVKIAAKTFHALSERNKGQECAQRTLNFRPSRVKRILRPRKRQHNPLPIRKIDPASICVAQIHQRRQHACLVPFKLLPFLISRGELVHIKRPPSKPEQVSGLAHLGAEHGEILEQHPPLALANAKSEVLRQGERAIRVRDDGLGVGLGRRAFRGEVLQVDERPVEIAFAPLPFLTWPRPKNDVCAVGLVPASSSGAVSLCTFGRLAGSFRGAHDDGGVQTLCRWRYDDRTDC